MLIKFQSKERVALRYHDAMRTTFSTSCDIIPFHSKVVENFVPLTLLLLKLGTKFRVQMGVRHPV